MHATQVNSLHELFAVSQCQSTSSVLRVSVALVSGFCLMKCLSARHVIMQACCVFMCHESHKQLVDSHNIAMHIVLNRCGRGKEQHASQR